MEADPSEKWGFFFFYKVNYEIKQVLDPVEHMVVQLIALFLNLKMEMHLPLINPICIISYILLFVMVSYHVLIDSLFFAKHTVTCYSLAVPYVELMLDTFKCHISWPDSPSICKTTHVADLHSCFAL